MSESRTRPAKTRHVPTGLYAKARFFNATPRFWRWLARVESAVLKDETAAIELTRPIYIAGVARSGTTILTEMLARHPDLASHFYADFPNIYTPFWRHWLAERLPGTPAAAVERAHKDRLMITAESPEAVEEVIWMQFFDRLHDSAECQVLDASTDNSAFETFYRDHLRKLLLARGRKRYLTKGNYNTTRLAYIQKLFPDARFVVPVRNPVNHVASLVKQDRLFLENSAQDPRVPHQLRMSGHYEFGPDKACIHTGDDTVADAIHAHWREGRLIHGWALYWNSVYATVLDQIEANPALKKAVMLLRYEDLCSKSHETIFRLVEHCRLPAAPFESIANDYAGRLTEPDYYRPDLNAAEFRFLADATTRTAQRLGYGSPDS